MRVLILHSRYRSGAVSGENRVVEDEATLLRDGGHDVRVWDPSPKVGGLRMLKTAVESIWSHAATSELRALVRSTRADIIHCHNLFPTLSPAVLRVGASEGAATVVTLHNYRLLCLPGNFLRNDQPCEDCLGRLPWPGVVHCCYHNSFLGSATMASSLTLHRQAHTFAGVQLFLAVSEFVRQKHIDAGWPPERVALKQNFAWPAPGHGSPGDYFLYMGRLSPEKGLSRLLRVWEQIPAKLVVAGTGPLEDELRSVAPPQVEFRGFLPPQDLQPVLARARAVVLPSICYEAQPRSVLEAYATAVPVIAHRLGGLPEVVSDGETGLLVDPGHDDGWVNAAHRLLDDREVERMGAAAYRRWQDDHSPERALRFLEAAYGRALASPQF